MEDWKSGIKFHFYTKRDMKFGCKDSCNSTFFCTIRIRKKGNRKYKTSTTISKSLQVLVPVQVKGKSL